MAIFDLAISGQPIVNGGAVSRFPQPKDDTGPTYMNDNAEVLGDISNFASGVDSRYKHGGSTGWERPGSNLA